MIPLPIGQRTMLSALFPRDQTSFRGRFHDGHDNRWVARALPKAAVGLDKYARGVHRLAERPALIAFHIIHVIVSAYLQSGKSAYGRHEAGLR